MPARATQPAGYPAGQAQIQVVDAGEVDTDSLELCCSGMQGAVEKHLDPRLTDDVWTTALAWFRPANPHCEGPVLLFDLDASVTGHLRPHAPYILRLRDGRGLKRDERLTWIAIRLPSRAPRGYVAPAGPKSPSPSEPLPADVPPAVAKTEASEQEAARSVNGRGDAATDADRARQEAEARQREETAVRQREQKAERQSEDAARRQRETETQETPRNGKPSGGRALAYAGLAALVLAAAGAGVWFSKDRLFGPSTPAPVVAPATPTNLEGARQFLAGNPGADESYGLAQTFRQAKQLDGAFLLLRNAAGKGNAAAALELGEMYDPETYSPETSPLPAPNPAQAADWYRQAAEAGIAEAQYRYGMLLKSGRTQEPNGPELGVIWLQKAADQGLDKAKEALEK
ncbi:MAG: SEL1-like repeat protein [Rhodospirillales bacterium]|nr:SEL1-like repeat protein [Rhodospirillales bacterium]